MKPVGRWSTAARITRRALAPLMAMVLAVSFPCRADDAPAAAPAPDAPVPAAPRPEATTEAAAPDPATARPVHRAPGRRLTVAQSIDESVRRLGLGLDLSGDQQQGLRQILVDQHRRIMQLRAANSAAGGDVTGMTLAIYDQTRARIRALLTDEQKKKYAADVPRGDLAPAQADLHHWMDLQEAKRRQEQAEGNPK